MTRAPRGTAFVIATCLCAPAAAETDGADATGSGDAAYEVTVRERKPVTASSTLTVPPADFALRPLESGGQMLEAVPGLITAQHTGGGKAEQYFVRGFDADHGTDLAVYFDGVPVNLRSHAHGQGFLDLHFVTPETIRRIDAAKGPYFAEYGDFATAAAVEYVPFGSLPESLVKFEGGEFDTQRYVGVLSPRTGAFAPDGPADALVSFEAYHTDGPYRDDEDLWRFSAFGKAGVDLSPDLRLSGHLLGYYGDWNASGLLPERAVEVGLVDRFGSLDPSEGGTTTRAQGKLQLDWDPSPRTHVTANAYLAWYALDLYSNFTFALDPANAPFGDGIVQQDRRLYTGGRIEARHALDVAIPTVLRGGVETRYDDARVKLGRQTLRTTRFLTDDDDVRELSVAPYAELEALPLSWVRFVGGLRFEHFDFDVENRLGEDAEGDTTESVWLPKANLIVSPFAAGAPLDCDWRALRTLELFANFGQGFHSNDARAAVADVSETALPLATGAEAGLRTAPFERTELAVSAFWLELESELTFVGDEGTTEAGPRSVRRGLEVVGSTWLTDWLYARGSLSYTEARIPSLDDQPVVQAPRFIAGGAVGVLWEGFAAELGMRALGDRYASEDFNNPKLEGYAVFDLGVRYRRGPFEVGLAVENLTNTSWRSSEFFFPSCVPGVEGPGCGPDGEGVPDFHFTPGNPRNVRGWVTLYF